MIEVDRRDFLKKASVAVAGLCGISLATKMVARDASHQLGVVCQDWAFSNKQEIVKKAWEEARKKLDKEHISSLWKGVFVPRNIKLVWIKKNNDFEFHRGSWVYGPKHKFLFEMSGVEIVEA